MHDGLERDLAHNKTVETFDLLRIMTGILRRFAGLGDRDLDQGIEDTLASIGSHARVDRCYLFMVSDDQQFVNNTHEWCAEGISPEIANLQQLPFETVHWWRPRLEAEESIYIPLVAGLPDDRKSERELLASQSIQSLLVVPLIGSGRLRGFLGFDSVKHSREWSPEARLLLRAVADIFVGAMARQDVLARLLAKERHFSALVQNSPDVLMVLDRQSRLVYLSPKAARLLGLSEENGLGCSLLDCCHPSDRSVIGSALAATGSGDAEILPDFRLRAAAGNWTWLMGTARDLSDDPAVGGIVLNAKEINDRKKAEQALQLQATHDALTGLPNRSLLEELLNQALGRCRRSGDLIGILFIDLDHFKLVNDGQGHRVGDELLIDVARRLLRELREGDAIARFGGDEFVAILNASQGEEKALAQGAERLLRVFNPPFTIAGVDRVITASAGLAISSGTASAEEAIGNADAAMYLAKERGRACLQFFDQSLRDGLVARIELESDLIGACERKELFLHYQPIFMTATRQLAGFEALLRWQHPKRGLVMPDEFISTLEQSGLIAEFGAWVLDEAVRQLRAWLEQDSAEDFYMSVNLSPAQLRDPAFPELVRSVLKRWQLPPSCLCLEVTETALMDHRRRSIESLGKLKELGVLLAIDDFGTGHSSLAYLRDLPVDKLKIDKSFIQHIGTDTSELSIVAAIQVLAKEYSLETIAEGVETEGQEQALHALGCDMLQGFRFGRPQAAQEAKTVIKKA